MADDVQLITGVQPEPKSAARLCNFATGKSALLPSHKLWLDSTVKPLVQGLKGPWVDLFGYASKLGNAQFNETLSKSRCSAAKDYIKTFNSTLQFPQEFGKGEAESDGAPDDNSGYWRAVSVFVYGAKPATRPVIPKKPVVVRPALPTWLQRIYNLMPRAERHRVAAIKVLGLANRAIGNQAATTEQKYALGLVNRIFKVTLARGATDASARQDIIYLLKIFNRIGLVIGWITGGQRYLHESKRANEGNDLAYCHAGHYVLQKPSDGIWYVKARNENASDADIIDRSMHEFAHFCGPMGANEIGHASVDGSPAYGAVALTLPRKDALVNASSYAYLAYLAVKPQAEWLTAT